MRKFSASLVLTLALATPVVALELVKEPLAAFDDDRNHPELWHPAFQSIKAEDGVVSLIEPATSSSTLRTVILYDRTAAEDFGGDAAIQEYILGVEPLYQRVLSNSRLSGKLVELVALPAPDAIQALVDGAKGNSEKLLTSFEKSRLAAEIRRQQNAAVIYLGVNELDVGGLTYRPTSAADFKNPRLGYGLLLIGRLYSGYVLLHEDGHRFGCRHDRDHPAPSELTEGRRKFLPYARGYIIPGSEDMGDVMAIVLRRLPTFSQPRKQFQGLAVGTKDADCAKAVAANWESVVQLARYHLFPPFR